MGRALSLPLSNIGLLFAIKAGKKHFHSPVLGQEHRSVYLHLVLGEHKQTTHIKTISRTATKRQIYCCSYFSPVFFFYKLFLGSLHLLSIPLMI